MVVKFYTTSKKVNSTAIPSGSGTSYDVILKEGCSVMQPSIRLKWSGSGSPASYNYAYISDFHRYYWVRDWRFEDRQWTADLTVDPLASYKTQIGASSQYVIRSASDYDGDVADVLYPTFATPHVQPKSAALWSVPSSVSDQTFVVSTMSSRGWQTYYLLSGAQYATICTDVFASNFFNGYDFGDLTEEFVKVLAKPEDNVVNVQWLPVSYSAISGVGSSTTGFRFGYYEVEPNATFKQVTPQTVYSFDVTLTMTQHPDAATRGSYLNGNTFTRRALTLPGVGTVALDSDLLIGYTGLRIEVRLNVASGTATLIVYGTATGLPDRRVWTGEAKVSVDFGYGTTRVDVPGVLSAVLGTAGAAANKSALGAAEGILNTIEAAFPSTTILSTSGSVGSYVEPMRMTETFYRQTEIDVADKGRPLCKVKTINTLSGYTVCSDAHVSIPGTDEESAAVTAYLNGGFFYE